MPRISEHERFHRNINESCAVLQSLASQWERFFGENSDILDDFVLLSATRLQDLENRRCVHRTPYRICDTAEFKKILYGETTNEIDTPRYRDSFIFNYRMDRVSFLKLNELIKFHRIFDSPKEGARIRTPSEVQLFVLLKYLGVMGTDASNRAASTFFRIGSGTAELFRR